jgi:hypothetical protein
MNLNKIRLIRASLPLLLMAALAFSFAACDMGNTDDDDDDEKKAPPPTIEKTEKGGSVEFILKDGEKIYLSLSTGEEITGEARFTQAWDIAFEETRLIYTNSGDTAKTLSSGGQGAVWHTDKTAFADVVLADAIKNDPFYGSYNTDTIRWTNDMQGIAPHRLNVMTYTGYDNEDQAGSNGMTEAAHFTIYHRYDKKQFYANTFTNGAMTMPPEFYTTMQVYIIRHGDGTHHSKFQVTKFVRFDPEKSLFDANSDTYGVRWENLD